MDVPAVWITLVPATKDCARQTIMDIEPINRQFEPFSLDRMGIGVEQDDAFVTCFLCACLCRFPMAVAMPVWRCGQDPNIGLGAEPRPRAIATAAIDGDHLVRSSAHELAHLLHQETEEEECVVSDRNDAYRSWHIFDVLPRSGHRLKNLPSPRPKKKAGLDFNDLNKKLE